VRPHLVLASASPARLETLRNAGIEPEVVVSGIDEDGVEGTTPEQTALLLAALKARAVASRVAEGLVVGCDSLLEPDGKTYGKPRSADEATARWRCMRGRSGVLHTGHCVVDVATGRCADGVASTVVCFADVTDEEIAAYVATRRAAAGGGCVHARRAGRTVRGAHRRRPPQRGRGVAAAAAAAARRAGRALAGPVDRSPPGAQLTIGSASATGLDCPQPFGLNARFGGIAQLCVGFAVILAHGVAGCGLGSAALGPLGAGSGGFWRAGRHPGFTADAAKSAADPAGRKATPQRDPRDRGRPRAGPPTPVATGVGTQRRTHQTRRHRPEQQAGPIHLADAGIPRHDTTVSLPVAKSGSDLTEREWSLCDRYSSGTRRRLSRRGWSSNQAQSPRSCTSCTFPCVKERFGWPSATSEYVRVERSQRVFDLHPARQASSCPNVPDGPSCGWSG